MYSRGHNSASAARLAGRLSFSRRAFTLIELLIVIVIIGILATIVLPQFTNASVTAKENTLKDELRYLRTQIVVYKAQHHDTPPGYPNGDRYAAPTAADFIAQMTKPTNEQGTTAATAGPVFKYGPYVNAMPKNPLNELNAVRIVDDTEAMPAPTGETYGWIYKPLTGEIIANSPGKDASGIEYKNY